jgi:hypothetical protein
VAVTAASERLAALLGTLASAGSFSARRTAPAGDLSIEVRGIGPLGLPVPDAQARQLCQIGRPARYGQSERTLLDPRVRDTWEVPLSRVRIDKRRWAKTLHPVLERLRRDLGLPDGCQLAAELHSMLVYAPGQFFVPHQDSEKDDAMVGSLVVTLPSSFTGGALVVEHGGQRVTYRGSKTSLSFVAFFADCRHQVQPTRSGHRVVLTYNLLLRGDTAADPAEPVAVDAAARCLDDHFTTPRPPRWAGDNAAADPPARLAYLLDHEYTERGLSWSRLKGSDATRAAALLAAGERAGCEVVLALAEVHETWDCFEDDRDWRRGRYHSRRRYADDEPDGEGWDDELDDDAGYEMGDLIDGSVTLERWVHHSDGRAEAVAVSLADHEVCATTPSAELRPYASEHEGYMGNYGNTMDRWYRRAAVVLWPRARAFAVRAEASPVWALDRLAARARAGDGDGAREMAATLAPFWAATARLDQSRGLPAKALRVARALDEPALATMLLEPLGVEVLTRSHAPALAALLGAYGEDWARGLLARWAGRPAPRLAVRDKATWMAALVPLCEALQAAGATGASAARLLVEDAWRWLRPELEHGRAMLPTGRRDQALRNLAPPVLAVLESSAVIGADELGAEVVELFRSGGDDDGLLPCLLAVLGKAAAGRPASTWQATGLEGLARHCRSRLEARLARSPRRADDWSIELFGGCGCDLCATLAEFLADPARRVLEWPIAEQRRRHVHATIDRAELPVRHQTRRAGRPYTLVLTKTEALFERGAAARRRDEADLARILAMPVRW